jgi:hypothetical protein
VPLLDEEASMIASRHSKASYSVFAEKKTVRRRLREGEKSWIENDWGRSLITVRFETKALWSKSGGPEGFASESVW